MRKKFTGYERDTETNLDFAQARYNSFTLGRFSSPDPLMASAKAGNPQTWNRYAYVINNPLKYVDPTGMIMEGSSEILGNKCDIQCRVRAGIPNTRDLEFLAWHRDNNTAYWQLNYAGYDTFLNHELQQQQGPASNSRGNLAIPMEKLLSLMVSRVQARRTSGPTLNGRRRKQRPILNRRDGR